MLLFINLFEFLSVLIYMVYEHVSCNLNKGINLVVSSLLIQEGNPKQEGRYK
jgi:hypothetical protein